MSHNLYVRLARRFAPERFRVDRRQALRLTLAAGAGMLLSNSGLARAGALGALRKPAGKRIVVIGAGFSGLACAHELLSIGYDVSIIEARKRVGGRVLSFSDYVPGRNIEGGAELIGSNHPTWVAYAEKFNLEFLDVTESEELVAPIHLNGKLLEPEAANSLWEQMDEAANQMNALAEPIDADKPWAAANAKELDASSVADWLKGLEIDDLTRLGLDVMISADNAVHVSRQSLLGHLAMVKGGGLDKYWTDSEVYRCKGGNQQLAASLAKAIGSDRINLELAARKIEKKGKSMIVECSDGRTFECEDVVLAVPPTVWNKIACFPALPASLKPQMGVAIKHLNHMKSRFWEAKGLAPDSLTDREVAMTWDATDNQGPGEPGKDGACLTVFSGGPAAEKLRAMPDDVRKKSIATQLDNLYPTFNDHFVQARWMDWPSEKWTGGGYSFPAPGEVTSMGQTLHNGLGNIHFAGEHVCYKFAGYMEGALNSGAALAQRIALRDGVAK